MNDSISDKFLVGITGINTKELIDKINEIKKLKITKVSIFPTFLLKKERKIIYEILLTSGIKEIPIVHARDDMDKTELEFFIKNFKTKCFTIHKKTFKYIPRWKGFQKKLFLELNYSNYISKKMDLNKIGGFCIDLSHFKAAEERKVKEFEYVMKRKNKKFIGSHLNGYDPIRKRDMHTIKNIKDFEYLKTLPKFIFGKYIALEMFNSIKEQLKYKKYLIKLLKNKI